MPNECRDPFIERLRCVRNLHESSCRLLEDHLVNDLTGHLQSEKRNTILLMESPHKSEVCKSYPLAGQAGAIVVGAFVGTMGEILHCEQFDDTPFKIFRQIGVMNVSRLPLQEEAYKNVDALCKEDCNLKVLLGNFQEIKRRFEEGKQRPPAGTEQVVGAIEDDLKRRIKELRCTDACANVCYVVCGKVAEIFLKKVYPNIKPIYVPHPGKPGAWFEGGTLLEKVQDIVDRLRCADTGPPSSASS